MSETGIYIHIPFCKTKCSYCNFYSVEHNSFLAEKYIAELENEIAAVGRCKNTVVDTVYIGGGTPSLLAPSQMERIVRALERAFTLNIEEFTVEINPCSADYLREYKAFGVNRISIGIQSTDEACLRLLERSHCHVEAIAALETAAKYYDNISVDLIAGITETQDIEKDITFLKDFAKHFSVYMLKLEEGTLLDSRVSNGLIRVPDDDRSLDIYLKAVEVLQNDGFYRYEISNFSKSGYESQHNLKYWLMDDYIGFGTAAHSKLDGKRYGNPSDIFSYIEGCHSGNGKQIYESFEPQSEEIMLALRLKRGLNIESFNKKYNTDFFKVYGSRIEKIKNCFNITSQTIRIKDEFLLLENSILAEIL